jgi:magnesium transporter
VRILESIDRSTISDLLARDEFFWLDLERPSPESIGLLDTLFHYHPLALEDSREFGQRPKLEDYENHIFLVYYGARPEGGAHEELLVEVHAFISGGFVVTLHERPCPALAALRQSLRHKEKPSEQFVIYRILDALTDSFFPALETIGERIDQLEAEILDEPTDVHLQRIFALRRDLVAIGRVVSPQRDLLASGVDEILELPGLEHETRNYFRDLYDHMLRIADLVDGYRDLLASSRDAYLSMVSNRLNSISEQLTIVATIFLPLAFVTGFFGQNFKWMTDHIQSFASFAVFGIGGLMVFSAALLIWFRRSGYLGSAPR